MVSKFEKIVCTTMDPSELKLNMCRLEKLLEKWMPRSVHLMVVCRLGILGKYPKDNLIQFFKYIKEGHDVDDWDGDEDPFIVCIQQPNIIAKKGIILMAPDPATPDMIKAFDSFIGWDSPMTFGAVPENIGAVILKLVDKHGEQFDADHHCNFYFLNVEKAKNLKIDEEFLSREKIKVRRFIAEEAELAVQSWPPAQDHSAGELKKHIQNGLFTSGIFTEDGELASSFMHSTLGLFNGLYTPEKFRRKGYGFILVSWMSKNVAEELGLPAMVEADLDNVASNGLLQKIGMDFVQRTRWIFYKPNSAALP